MVVVAVLTIYIINCSFLNMFVVVFGAVCVLFEFVSVFGGFVFKTRFVFLYIAASIQCTVIFIQMYTFLLRLMLDRIDFLSQNVSKSFCF